MKKILMLAAMVLLSTAAGSRAEQQERLVLAREFSEVLGFQSMFDSMKEQTDASLNRQIAEMMRQTRRNLAGIPSDYLDEMVVAANEYMDKLKNAWNAQEAADVYAEALAERLPPDALRKAIRHCRTPEGQKELKAINEAASRLNVYVTSSMEKASAEGLPEFLAKIKIAAERAQNRQAEARERGNDGEANVQPTTAPGQE